MGMPWLRWVFTTWYATTLSAPQPISATTKARLLSTEETQVQFLSSDEDLNDSSGDWESFWHFDQADEETTTQDLRLSVLPRGLSFASDASSGVFGAHTATEFEHHRRNPLSAQNSSHPAWVQRRMAMPEQFGRRSRPHKFGNNKVPRGASMPVTFSESLKPVLSLRPKLNFKKQVALVLTILCVLLYIYTCCVHVLYAKQFYEIALKEDFACVWQSSESQGRV